jgi:hypothetical protein
MVTFLALCATGMLGSVCASPAAEVGAAEVAVVTALYGEPTHAEQLAEVDSAVARLWRGTVWSRVYAGDAAARAWSFDAQEPPQSFATDLAEAQRRFQEGGSAAAIPILERLVAGSADLLPALAGTSTGAELLLKAHLLLWWSLDEVGEKGRLATLMQETARRFPAAKVTTTEWPPRLAEAFAVAKQFIGLDQTTLAVELRSQNVRGCSVTVNGIALAGGPSASVPVARGVSYYVGGECPGVLLRPRRVAAVGATTVVLDTELNTRVQRTENGAVLRLDGGPDDVAQIVRLAVGFGRVIGTPDGVVAGVFRTSEGDVLQLDRVNVNEGVRRCSVRLPLTPDLDPRAIDEAVHVLHVGKPTVSASVRFASEDRVYRTSDEYVDWARDDKLYVGTWTGLGLTLAAAGLTAYFNNSLSDSEAELNTCGANQSCRRSTALERARRDVAEGTDRRDALAWTTVGLGIGTIVIFLFEYTRGSEVLAPGLPEARSPAPIGPWLQPNAAGVTINLTFD